MDKKALLEAKKQSKIQRILFMNEAQIMDLREHKDIRTYAEAKRKWAGEGGEFAKREVKNYYKAYDANEIFI
jgi:hypothetical protein